jgi:hypothetical protein
MNTFSKRTTILRSFHGDPNEKNHHLKKVKIWLDKYRANYSDSPICILEEYDSFTEKLGLPMWFSNLLRTINQHNSQASFRSGGKYEDPFYLEILLACNVDVDYSLMFHKWEIFLLTELLPQNDKELDIIKKVIRLHEESQSGNLLNRKEWFEVRNELNDILDHIYKNGKKELEVLGIVSEDSIRAAFLSVNEVTVDFENVYTTSAEAIVDANIQDTITSSDTKQALIDITVKLDNEERTRLRVWNEIMNKLLVMLKDWN